VASFIELTFGDKAIFPVRHIINRLSGHCPAMAAQELDNKRTED
jgi:hypothetical protein